MGKFFDIPPDTDKVTDFYYLSTFFTFSKAAKNKELLKDIGITYVLNAAEGNRTFMVDTSKEYYEGTGIKYMGLQLKNASSVMLSPHFHTVAEFIDEGISSNSMLFYDTSIELFILLEFFIYKIMFFSQKMKEIMSYLCLLIIAC